MPEHSLRPGRSRGWSARPYNWEFSTERAARADAAASASTSATSAASTATSPVTQNRAVTPADYTSFSIPAPSDPRLPTAAAARCGLFNLKPNKVGQVDNYVTMADNFGEQIDTSTAWTSTPTRGLARPRLQGGVSTGR